MENNLNNDTDNLFHSVVESHEMKPSGHVWSGLNYELEKQKSDLYRKRLLRFQYVSAVLGVALISVLLFNYFTLCTQQKIFHIY